MNWTPYFRWGVDLFIFGLVFSVMWMIAGIFIGMVGIHDGYIQFCVSLFSALPLGAAIARSINLIIDVQVPE